MIQGIFRNSIKVMDIELPGTWSSQQFLSGVHQEPLKRIMIGVNYVHDLIWDCG